MEKSRKELKRKNEGNSDTNGDTKRVKTKENESDETKPKEDEGEEQIVT